MNLISARKTAGLFAVLTALMMGVPGLAQTGAVTGKAIKNDGTLCVKCQIAIAAVQKETHEVYKTETNKKGMYVHQLPQGFYKITLSDPHGKLLYTIEAHIDSGAPTVVNFDLPNMAAAQKKVNEQMAKSNPQFAKDLAEHEKQEAVAKRNQQQYSGMKKFFDEGNALYQQKDYKGAAAAYEKAVTVANGKNLGVVLMHLGDAYQKTHEYQLALEAYQKAAKLTPDSASLHNDLGTLYGDMGKFSEARAEFEKAAQLDPAGASRYYFNVGAVMYNAGNMDEAVAAAKKVIQIDPQNAQAYYLEGQALAEKTIEAFQMYLKLEPNGPRAATARQTVIALQNQ